MKLNRKVLEISVALTPIKGTGHLKIMQKQEMIVIKWHEDWDTEASTDLFRVKSQTGDINLTCYREDNFKSQTEEIDDRKKIIQRLQHITEKLKDDSKEFKKAKQFIEGLIKKA